MGQSYSGLTKQELSDYQELTYLTRNEIIKLHRQFCLATGCSEAYGEARNARMTPDRVPELKVNPFRGRLCEVFASSADGSLLFDEYVDMMSVLSLNAPRNLKAEYAFRMYDSDNDDIINRVDLYKVIDTLTGDTALPQETKDRLANRIFDELDVDGRREDGLEDSEGLVMHQFHHLISKKPDILNVFHVRIKY